jgi:hypothetical protein
VEGGGGVDKSVQLYKILEFELFNGIIQVYY